MRAVFLFAFLTFGIAFFRHSSFNFIGMKKQVLSSILIAFFPVILFSACEKKKPETITTSQPEEFNPVEEEPDRTATAEIDTQENIPEAETIVPERKLMPTVEELKTVTPSQEAKRELSNDAMKAAQMKPEKFAEYMQSRIPYYRGKGNLKAENDMVRIQITKKEMTIETIKGRQTFPMQ